MDLIKIGNFSLQWGLSTLRSSYQSLQETQVTPVMDPTTTALPGSICSEAAAEWSRRTDEELSAAARSLEKLYEDIHQATDKIYRNDADISQKMALPTNISSQLQDLLGPTP